MGGLRRHRRRTGTVAVLLVVGSLIVTSGLARLRGWDFALSFLGLVGGVTALAAFWLGWVSARDEGKRGEATLDDLADGLADAVREQWATEAARRRINDPAPLPMRWVPADPALVEDWDSVDRLARTGLGWYSPSEVSALSSGWATEPDGLAGVDNELADRLGRVPTGRLVVLGEPGAGKTMLAMRLVLDLIGRRKPGGPVPLLVPLAAWNPRERESDLYGWLEQQLITDHPWLSLDAPGGAHGTRARSLLNAGLVVPVLDGLDEIPKSIRGPAIAGINDALRPRGRVVLLSRSGDYQAAVSPANGPEVRLTGAAGIELCPIEATTSLDYLRRSSGGPRREARWRRVIAAVDANPAAPVALTLTTPLMATLARTIYNPRPGDEMSPLPDPVELLDSANFPNRERVEDALFDGFVPAAYRRHPDRIHRCPWDAADCERWLVFLARWLERSNTSDLRWWDLPTAAPRHLSGIAAGVSIAIAIGLAFFLSSIRIGIGLGVILLVGLAVALALRDRRREPGDLPVGLLCGIVGGVLGGCTAWSAAQLGIGPLGDFSGGFPDYLTGPLGAGLAIGVVGGLRGGLAGGFVGGLVGGVVGDPLTAYAPDTLARIVNAAFNGIAFGVAGCLNIEIAGRRMPAQGLEWSTAGIVAGLFGGIGIAATGTAISGPATGLLLGLVTAAAGVLAAGLAARPPDLMAPVGPAASLARDRRTFLGIGVAAGLCLSSATVAIGAPAFGVATLLGGVLWFAFFHAAWGTFAISRCWLALRSRLPWRCMAFLADACEERGVLRQVGASYQFRHLELQRRLAHR